MPVQLAIALQQDVAGAVPSVARATAYQKIPAAPAMRIIVGVVINVLFLSLVVMLSKLVWPAREGPGCLFYTGGGKITQIVWVFAARPPPRYPSGQNPQAARR